MIKYRNDLTSEEVRAVLDYNPETGNLIWKIRRGSKSAGKIAGHKKFFPVSGKTYIVIGINNALYLGHRICWLIHTGVWPTNHLDHIDMNGLNNKIKNLRDATHSENLKNSLSKGGTSKFKGIHFREDNRMWRAQTMHNGKKKSIGHFLTEDEAQCAWEEFAKSSHGEFFNRGC